MPSGCIGHDHLTFSGKQQVVCLATPVGLSVAICLSLSLTAVGCGMRDYLMLLGCCQ